jgi:uncharacterized protein (TIGR02001 family)
MTANRNCLLLVLATGVSLGLGQVAYAADVSGTTDEEAVAHMFDVAFGVAVTTDYLSSGITQTDHGPAIQGYVEPSYGIAYAGIWASNVKFGGEADVEVDFYAGIRPEYDIFSFDFGYLHWRYLTDPSNGGYLYAKVDAAVHDSLTVGGKVEFTPSDSSTTVEANADLSFHENFGLSGAIAHIGGDVPYATWNAGVYYVINDIATLDLRYTDTSLSTSDCFDITGITGNECDARVVLSLSVDLTASSLHGQ